MNETHSLRAGEILSIRHLRNTKREGDTSLKVNNENSRMAKGLLS